jgi:hypothetical protein
VAGGSARSGIAFRAICAVAAGLAVRAIFPVVTIVTGQAVLAVNAVLTSKALRPTIACSAWGPVLAVFPVLAIPAIDPILPAFTLSSPGAYAAHITLWAGNPTVSAIAPGRALKSLRTIFSVDTIPAVFAGVALRPAGPGNVADPILTVSAEYAVFARSALCTCVALRAARAGPPFFALLNPEHFFEFNFQMGNALFEIHDDSFTS